MTAAITERTIEMFNEYETVFGETDAGIFLGGEGAPISNRTMQRWRSEGIGPKFLKIGMFVRYRLSDLEEFRSDCCRTSTCDTGERGAS